ncbi:haloacid dehalogenase type II [Methylobrevis albus]|uniref:(S)-2-haloacid dehalogenase n=1 Tax=Methylobrevis albus TaxID=2793297 RepID=A0A931I191_9HYPH|nr:haloacid dehalogenase type II [Methylobrevis albus]MBH0237088.1 haloacid dehalogenase type II [Methylobrevis albus]
MRFSVYVFDAYGTLFDVHSAVRRHAAALGPDAQRLSEIWRAKQLEYSWVRTLGRRYRSFWLLTEDALDWAFTAVPTADRGLRADLLDAYAKLDCYPEVPALLTELRDMGVKIAILSNGSPKMLDKAVSAAGLDGLFDEVLSVDAIHVYKPDPQVYDIVTNRFRVFPSNVSFQSSNRWDIAGASEFGFRSVWINRIGAADEYAEMKPAAVLPSLTGLTALG